MALAPAPLPKLKLYQEMLRAKKVQPVALERCGLRSVVLDNGDDRVLEV